VLQRDRLWIANPSTAGALAERQNRRPDPFTKHKKRQLNAGTLNDAGLNMKAAPEMRDLAHRLLTYEAGADKTSEPKESASIRVYEKLRQSLSGFAGRAAFESLAFRALAQAKSEAPGLWALQVAEDGSLKSLGEFESQIDIDKELAGEGGIVLIARLLGLLRLFLGEALTLSLLRSAWPREVFDDRN
jgi:hypothetical protein